MKVEKKQWFVYLILLSFSSTYGQIQTIEAFPNITFKRPVDIQHPGDNSNRLFVVEQQGKIWVFENNSTVLASEIFLDITQKVDNSDDEEGLLGLAFHPEFSDNGYFYVNYTASSPSRTVISRFEVSDLDSNLADPGSEFIILEFNQPFGNHNGGQLAFGPIDGFLYVAIGDGGSSGDPAGYAQSLNSLLGKIIRIDVDSTDQESNYGIPTDNPFYENTAGYREEIYAFGLRNPWRFSFDPDTEWLWAADVGQNLWEEIDIIVKGGNYGWNIFEGNHCFSPPCDTSGLVMPIWEYNHDTGRSVTGGFVYRGIEVPELNGKYIYADYISGKIWALTYDGENPPINTELFDTNLLISSFGIDQDGELYFSAFDGKIYKFKSSVSHIENINLLKNNYSLKQNYPNPFNPNTFIEFILNKKSQVQIIIYDVQGKKVKTLFDQEASAGLHSVMWNGRNDFGQSQASGTFYYQLKINSSVVDRRKMLLLK
jgi:glucose/arabinose dehydrogenase